MGKRDTKSMGQDDSSLDVLPSGTEQTSPPQRTLEDLRTELETGEMNKEQREKLLTEAMQTVMTEEAKAVLGKIGEENELSEEAVQILGQGTTFLLALADYRDREISSVQDLITEYRVAPDEPSRLFAQALIHVIAQAGTPASQTYQLEIWEESKTQSDEVMSAIEGIELSYERKKQEELEVKKEKAERKEGKEDTWYARNQGVVNSALIGGALLGGVLFVTHHLFKAKDGDKADGGSSFGLKAGVAALLGAEVIGQAVGFEQVRDMISGGDKKHWIYSTGMRGLAAAADLEVGMAMDFWTGNGPTEGEQTMFTEMAEIFDTSDTRLWTSSKLGFDEFLGGKNGSMLPWAQDDDARVRAQIKDFYLPQLEDRLPYLKNPRLRATTTLKQVLIDGYKVGVIKELDVTDLAPADAEAVTKRSAAADRRLKESRTQFDHPEENLDELDKTGSDMIAVLGELDASTDQYANDLLVSFENMIGVDFDLGEDDQGEYRDLKQARETLHAFFDGVGAVDHAFFKEKKGRVEAFKVFLAKHKDEKPWTAGTITEYEAYKTEMLELQDRIQASLELAEISNLKDMAEHRTGTEVIEDASEFGVVGLSGGLHYLKFHLEQLAEGDKLYWGITIAYGVAVATQYVDVDVVGLKISEKPSGSLLWRLGPGAVWQGAVTVYKTGKMLWNGTHLFNAYRFTPEELLKRVLKGEMTENDVRTRIDLAKEFQDTYKTRWRRWTRKQLTVAKKTIGDYEDLGKNMDYLAEMEKFFDGKMEFERMSQLAREYLARMKLTPDLNADGIQEIRFVRAVRQMRSNPAFLEVIEHFRNSTRPLSVDGQALYDALTPEQQRTCGELMRNGKGEAFLGKLTQAEVPKNVPEHLGPTADGAGHRYRYGGVEYELTETQIGERAGRVDAERLAAGEAPEPGKTDAWNKANWERAIRDLCHERFTTPVEIRPGAYRYAGVEFEVNPAEVTRIAADKGIPLEEAARELCVKQGTGHLFIEEVRPRTGGGYDYKMGGEWISPQDPATPATAEHVRTMFEVEMAKQGKAFDFAKIAGNAKALKFAADVEKFLGPVAAVAIIMHLEGAEDKRKAVCEVGAGFIGFAAGFQGAKAFDERLGRYIKDGRVRFVMDLLAGAAAAYGLTEPIAEIMDHYFASVPASHAVGVEMGEIIEGVSYRMLFGSTARSIESGLIKKGIEGIGMRGLTLAFETRIKHGFMKKIGALAARQGFRKVLGILGWKGVATAALLADDATVIGVADDIVALGLGVWMAVDIVQMLLLISNAVEVQKQMEVRKGLEIESFDIKDATSRAAFQKALIPYGLTIERATELPEEALFDILRTLPSVRVEMTRKDTLGSEIWTLNHGEAVGIAILGQPSNGQPGEVLCQISDEDAAEMEEALVEIEKAEAKEAGAAEAA